MQSRAQKRAARGVEVTPLASLLAERIRTHGPLTFADYMEACLYHPLHGYYTKPLQEARRDYFTNADFKPIFGRLLARQFEEMWMLLERPDPFWLVEAGAGTGNLARAVLDSVEQSFPRFGDALLYVAVERSAARRAAQAMLLDSHIRGGRCVSVTELPREVRNGCVFSNELLDALPVHRVLGGNSRLAELYVGLQEGRLSDEAGPLSSPRIPDYFAQQGAVLCQGQQAEAGLAACDWIHEVGTRLRRGFVLTVDYGREASELYDQLHMRGTLLAYQRHRASEEYFRAPGDQDLTAHVNFTALDLWGRESGLLCTGRTTQSKFLLSLARQGSPAEFHAGITEEEKTRQRLLFKTLINPEGMGEAFQVLIQHKNAGSPALRGLDPL